MAVPSVSQSTPRTPVLHTTSGPMPPPPDRCQAAVSMMRVFAASKGVVAMPAQLPATKPELQAGA